jgi:hypothetical protein
MLFFGVDMKQKGTGSQQAHFFLYIAIFPICVLHTLLFFLFTKRLYIEKVVLVPYS